jgi:tRNA pseudouridine13 synthase
MYKIKQIPEDFIVKEIASHELDESGNYSYFILKKENYNTLDAVKLLSKFLRVPIRYIGFAGSKDKNAVTEQVCSVYRVPKEKLERLRLKYIQLTYIGKGKKPISLGDLKGNSFKIIIRNLTSRIKRKKIIIKKIPNYFGKQRFSENNIKIGRYIIKRNFQKAVELINQKEVKFYLEDNPGDFAGAIRQIPLKLRKMYVHAYQAYLWNRTAEEYIKTKPIRNEKIPILGFGTELKQDTIGKIMRKLMNEESITQRDFIIKNIPELSSEGGQRYLFVTPENVLISEPQEDELNKGKYKVIIGFVLPKGSYATTVIDELFSSL